MVASRTYSLATLSKATGKNRIYIQNLQKAFTLRADSKDRYSSGYISFMKKVIALRTASVKQERITELFALEKKILKLMHIDSLSDAETWYLDANCAPSERTLLLTGFDVEFALNGAIQPALDFGGQETEMFKSHEMGEDLHEILERYVTARNKILARAAAETPLIKKHLKLAGQLIRSAGFE